MPVGISGDAFFEIATPVTRSLVRNDNFFVKG